MTNKQKNTSSTGQVAPKFIILNFTSHKVPELKEVKGKKYVYFGKDNDYPDYLLNLYNRSAKHNAIVNSKAYYIAGAGFEKGDIKVNAEGETWNDIIYKIAIDCELFGGFYLEVIWGRGNGKPAEIRHVDYNHIRSNEDNTEFYFTKKWFKDYGLGVNYPNEQVEDEDDWQVYPAFDSNKKTGKQLYYFKVYRPGIKTYPLPEYLGATAYIELDYQIANFWYNSVKFGFSASHIINFYNGTPTEEKRKEIEKQIQDKMTGTDQAGIFILNFADSKERGSEIQTIPQQDLDKQFQILNKTVQQEIFTGHRITSPMLFGIKTEGQLGGRTELIEANELFTNSYIKPKQKQLESALFPLFEIAGLKDMILKTTQPIGLDMLDDKLFGLLTASEKRAVIGKEPLPEQTEENGLVTVLNSLSPVIANKVLNSLTEDEIRNIAGLSPRPAGSVLPPENEELEQKATSLFKQYAKDLTGKILSKKTLSQKDIENLEEAEDRLRAEHFVAKNIYIDTQDRTILDLIDKDPLITVAEISKALELKTKDVIKSIEGLTKDKFLSKKGDELRLSTSAKSFLMDLPAPTETIFVMYSYEWIEGFSDSDIDESREFCKELRQMTQQGKLWSRKDIEKISNEAGWDVWRMRGGWYTKPNTDVHVPFCRHIWTQNLIQK